MSENPGQAPAPPIAAMETAARLHSAAIHLLRRLRVVDAELGLSAPRLSALSVVVFGGPITISDLAAAEQVRVPTISRLIRQLEQAALVERVPDEDDRRVTRVRATAEGRRLLRRGRARRVDALAIELSRLPAEERVLLERAATLLERLALPTEHPRQAPRAVV